MHSSEDQKKFYERSKEILSSGPKQSEEFVKELRQLIVYHEWKYYVQH